MRFGAVLERFQSGFSVVFEVRMQCNRLLGGVGSFIFKGSRSFSALSFEVENRSRACSSGG
jgi:hypothetical protein